MYLKQIRGLFFHDGLRQIQPALSIQQHRQGLGQHLQEYRRPQKDLWQYAKLKKPLSTGPFFTDPASAGLPNFNEFYVLRTSSDARNAVLSGSYKTALDWYIATKPDIRTHANQK